MEHFAPGIHVRTLYDPRIENVNHDLMQNLSNDRILQADFNDSDDFEFCKEQIGISSHDKTLIDSVVFANKYSRDSAMEVDCEKRENMLQRALDVCPKNCPMSHYFLLEVDLMHHDKKFPLMVSCYHIATLRRK